MTRFEPVDPKSARVWNRFREAGQEHVFRAWESLDDATRARFFDELEQVDLDLVGRLSSGGSAPAAGPAAEIRPAPALRLGEEPPGSTRRQAASRGEDLLRAGKVGVFLVAGGQGSRLGFQGPKGCLPFGPLSGRTLFEIHAAKIAHLRARHGAAIPWYVMTSPENDRATREYFDSRRFFGLPEDEVVFVVQGMLPAVDARGKLLLAAPGRLSLSPNGHGGAFAAFRDHGALEDARRRGVEHIFYFQVDNPLVRVADPLFLGLHDALGSEMSLKVLEKTGPEEKIGVIALRDGSPAVVEYSDLPRKRAEERGEDGRLVFGLGSIAIHAFRLDFMARVAEGSIDLPYHVAEKKIHAIDPGGAAREVPGRKFERFVFDALPAARKFLNLEVVREREFAPVKNRTGVDSIDSARELSIAEHRRWLAKAGVVARGRVEVSPLAALAGAELSESLAGMRGTVFEGDVEVEKDASGRVRVHAVPAGAGTPEARPPGGAMPSSRG